MKRRARRRSDGGPHQEDERDDDGRREDERAPRRRRGRDTLAIATSAVAEGATTGLLAERETTGESVRG